MMDAGNVISTATKKIVDRLTADYEVSGSRMYEILGKDNPYPKTKVLIRAIARHNQSGARLIKADLDSMFEEILSRKDVGTLTAADLHREAFEAVQALLEDKADADKKQELRELIVIAELMLEGMEKKLKLA